ncbi:MAG: hypothetical protein J6Y03_00205 [Alphaproteobacteria bacterium]|nr:hypothetical protein [Alphaproteobacteria bacterium]
MSESLVKKFNLPFKEIVLASDDGMNGVLMQEILPDFFICPVGSERIEVKEILRQDVKNGNLYSAVLEHLKGVPHPDISFAEKSLNMFYKEYTLIRENGLNCLVSAAQKAEVPFLFHEKYQGKDFMEHGNCSAYFDEETRTINLMCRRYIEDGNDRQKDILRRVLNIEGRQNVLAHEMGHMLMSNVFSEKNRYGDFIAQSEFGEIFDNLIRFEFSLTSPGFDFARRQYEIGLRREHWTKSPYAKFIWVTYKDIIGAYSGEDETSELFANMLGLAALTKEGLAYWNEGDTHRVAIETVLNLAKLCSVFGLEGYNTAKDIISNFSFSQELKAGLGGLFASLQDTWDRGIIPSVYQLCQYDDGLGYVEQLFCTESKKMQEKIGEKLKIQGKDEEYVKCILKAQNDFSKKADPRIKQYC